MSDMVGGKEEVADQSWRSSVIWSSALDRPGRFALFHVEQLALQPLFAELQYLHDEVL